MSDYGEYLQEQVDMGFIREDGRPVKCFNCESMDLVQGNVWHEGSYIVEYTLICNTCKKQVGHWAYGSWQV